MTRIKNGVVYDNSNNKSIDFDNRRLYDSAGNLLFDWSSGMLIPTARYIYLVSDAADVTKMGGTANNVYSTAQTAYDAANTLQLALGSTNKVIIQVGNITSAVAGNITLTSDWNPNVWVNGINSDISVIGNITLSNASGNGRNFGTSESVYIVFSNLKFGNITTNATGASGNAGSIYFRTASCIGGNITSECTNGTNSTGSSGDLHLLNTIGGNFGVISNRLASSSSSGATGKLHLHGLGSMRITRVGNSLTNQVGASQGEIIIENVTVTTDIKIATLGGIINLRNVTFVGTADADKQLVISSNGNDLTSDLIVVVNRVMGANDSPVANFNNPEVSVGFEVGADHTNGDAFVDILNCGIKIASFSGINQLRIINSILRGDDIVATIDNCIKVNIHNSTLEHLGGTATVLDLTNVTLLDLTILQSSLLGGTNSITSDDTIDVKTGASYYEVTKDLNTVLVPLTMDA